MTRRWLFARLLVSGVAHRRFGVRTAVRLYRGAEFPRGVR